MAKFDGRRILVTGASGGLGTDLCRHLLTEGCHVIGTARDEDKLSRFRSLMPDGPGRLTTAIVDQADPDKVSAIISKIFDSEGPIDSLVNNAAVYPKSPADKQDITEMQSVLNVNAVSATALMGAVVPGMKKAGFGRIINVSSITFALGFAELSAYVSSKGALIGLTRVWARELGADNITVNAISPGAFQTDAEKIHPDPEGYSRFVLNQQAIKRRGIHQDFTHTVSFLLSIESGFITGQNITVDGGWVMQ